MPPGCEIKSSTLFAPAHRSALHVGRARATPAPPLVQGRLMTLKIGVYLADDVARRFRLALRRSRTTKSSGLNHLK
jgi:hypothetical protein